MGLTGDISHSQIHLGFVFTESKDALLEISASLWKKKKKPVILFKAAAVVGGACEICDVVFLPTV